LATRLTRKGLLISLGAEAALIKFNFFGIPSILKYRMEKPYRDPLLDKLLKYRRTLTEAKIIKELHRIGVSAPALLYVDPSEGALVLEFIDGELLSNIIKEKRIDEACNYLEKAGRWIALMHKAGIAHGDLTPANMIAQKDDVYLIDFGLSKFTKRTEDLATDLHLFIRSLESAHHMFKDRLLKCFLNGYKPVMKEKFEEINRVVKEIRLRGRYVEERRTKIFKPLRGNFK